MIIHELEYATRIAVSCALSPPNSPDATITGLSTPFEPPTRSGCFRSAWSDFTRRRRMNVGAYPLFPVNNGEDDLNLPLMPLWRPTSPISNPCLPRPANIYPHGTESLCACRNTLALFDRSPSTHPLLVHAPTSTYAPPTLQWRPPPIVEALRDVDTDSGWGVEARLDTWRDIFCGPTRTLYTVWYK